MDLKLVFVFSVTSDDLLSATTWREFTAGLYGFSAAEQVLAGHTRTESYAQSVQGDNLSHLLQSRGPPARKGALWQPLIFFLFTICNCNSDVNHKQIKQL